MPLFKSNDKPKAEPGKHLFILTDVRQVTVKNSFYEKDLKKYREEIATGGSPSVPSETREKFIWEFESTKVNPAGEHYGYQEWTGIWRVEKSGLKKFVDKLMPEATEDQKRSVERDDLVGKAFEGLLTVELGKNEAKYVVLTHIEPATGVEAETAVAEYLARQAGIEQSPTEAERFDPDEIPF